jgi:Cd2+/Zn2+-exporting ATPase/Cu+-exporting ATPase
VNSSRSLHTTGEQTLELRVEGMDCTECSVHVREAIAALPGVFSVRVLLAAEKAIVQLDPETVTMSTIQHAVAQAGYSLADTPETRLPYRASGRVARPLLTLLALTFGSVLFIVIIGEWFGLFDAVTERIPWPIGLAFVLLIGYPVFLNVARATLRGKVISHTLMSVGVLGALLIGQWATAAVVVFFMRVGDYAERFTTERGRQAVKELAALPPQTARVERGTLEPDIPVAQVQIGDVVIVRPGESIPVDGDVLSGQATVDQAAITGESLPVEVGPGTHVYAASLAQLGSLRVRATRVGTDSTVARVIQLVEEAETNRAQVQRMADTFATYYLPVVAIIAALTFLLRRDPLATAAVLVVACSCSLALATPIAVLASVGAAAKRGLLIKGGKYLEALARADVIFLDKTGTLTLGRPHITNIYPLQHLGEDELVALAASADHYSEHPLAEALRMAARDRGLSVDRPDDFEALPGLGVRARLGEHTIAVGNHRLVSGGELSLVEAQVATWTAEGKALLYVTRDDHLVGLLAATDTLRSEVPDALAALRTFGIEHIELLTGDNERAAATLSAQLGIAYQANLLPEEKIALVKHHQAQGHMVVMVGDGINDAPALAQADVGMAIGTAGTTVATEAAHIALLRNDWMLVPEAFSIARRTMGVVKLNIGFTLVYNVVGLSLAALGFLPPILAAAAQSLPDVGILANSSRLLRQRAWDSTIRHTS